MRKVPAPLMALAAVLAATVAGWYALAPRALRVEPGMAAPDFSLPHYNQPRARGNLAALRGSLVLLFIFDSSWPTSGNYLLELEKVHRRYLQQGLVVMGIALDPPEEEPALLTLLHNRSVSFTVLRDPGGRVVGPLYGVPPARRPETYLVDPTGRVHSVYLEAQPWARQDRLDLIASLLPPPRRAR